jgi:MarR family transcriptional regulator for hemolysin
MDGMGKVVAWRGRERSGADETIVVPERGIGFVLREANRAFSHALIERLKPHGITFSQWLHLRTLWEEDGLTQVELARRIGIEKASSTPVLDSLERLKLIRRERNPDDRRERTIRLTRAGKAIKGRLVPHAVAFNATARRGLKPQDIATFLRVIHVMVDNLRQAQAARRR